MIDNAIKYLMEKYPDKRMYPVHSVIKALNILEEDNKSDFKELIREEIIRLERIKKNTNYFGHSKLLRILDDTIDRLKKVIE